MLTIGLNKLKLIGTNKIKFTFRIIRIDTSIEFLSKSNELSLSIFKIRNILIFKPIIIKTKISQIF